jgi:hypothetical protein
MLISTKEEDIRASVKCLQILTYSNKKYWKSVIQFGAIEKLCVILKKFSDDLLTLHDRLSKLKTPQNIKSEEDDQESIKLLAQQEKELIKQRAEARESIISSKQYDIALNTLSVLCNLCDQFEIKKSLSEFPELVDIIVKILRFSQDEDIESRIAILIGDIVIANENFKLYFEERGKYFLGFK